MDDDFEQFAVRELPALLRFAVMLTGDRELARDLVQDVMLKAHSQWRQVSRADHPRLYVRTMITHSFISWRRRWSVRNVLIAYDPDQEPPPSPDPAVHVTDRADIWDRLATLPRQQRAVLVLRYYEQLTDSEIATVLDCSPGTVRGYAARALATLRLDLRPEHNLERS